MANLRATALLALALVCVGCDAALNQKYLDNLETSLPWRTAEHVVDLAFSADGDRLAATGSGASIRLWGMPGGELLGTYTGKPGDQGSLLAFTPVSSQVLASNDRTLLALEGQGLREMATGAMSNPYPPPCLCPLGERSFFVVDISHSKILLRRMVLDAGQVGGMTADAEATLWQGTASDDSIPPVVRCAFSPDCSRIAFFRKEETSIRVYEIVLAPSVQAQALPGIVLNAETAYVIHLAWSPDLSGLAVRGAAAPGSGAEQIEVYQTASGAMLSTLMTFPEGGLGGGTGLAYSPDGRLLAARGNPKVNRENYLYLWRASDGELLFDVIDPVPITALTFSPDSQRLVVGPRCGDEGDADGCYLKIWDVGRMGL